MNRVWGHDMCWRHERANFIFLIVLTVCSVTAVSETCDDLQCLNSNPCQSFIQDDNTTRVRCVCGGKWAGLRCQHQIRLKPEVVTSSEAQLKVDLMTLYGDDVTASRVSSSAAMSLVSRVRQEDEDVELNYTLVYWKRNDTLTALVSGLDLSPSSEGVSCVLLHKRNSRHPAVAGLTPSTWYTVCIENGFIDSCFLSSFAEFSSSSAGDEFSTLSSSSHFVSSTSRHAEDTSPWPSNCVTIFTPGKAPVQAFITKSSTVTIVAGVSVLILTILVVVFILFLVRRQNVAARVLLDDFYHRCCPPCCRPDKDDGLSQERARLSQSSSVATSRSTTTFMEEDEREREEDFTRGSVSSAKNRNRKKRTLLERLKPCRTKRPKSSTYTSANMLLEPPLPPPPPLPCPSSSTHSVGPGETAPLGSEYNIDDLDDSVFENFPDPPEEAMVAALPTIHGGRNRPRRRLSRKRRGYVAYSTRKDKNIRLTTVLESPHGDDDDFDMSFLEMGHSSI